MAVVFMGSESDLPHCQKIKDACTNLGFHCDLRVTSAHKGTEETLEVLAHYEGKFMHAQIEEYKTKS